MPLALTVKSVKGSLAAQSWLGWAAVWMTSFDVLAVFGEELGDALLVADVAGVVEEVGAELLEALAVPGGGGGVAEETAAHVVVDADDPVELFGEKLDAFAADEACGPGDQTDIHDYDFVRGLGCRSSSSSGSRGKSNTSGSFSSNSGKSLLRRDSSAWKTRQTR